MGSNLEIHKKSFLSVIPQCRVSNESLMVMSSRSWGNKRSVYTHTYKIGFGSQETPVCPQL